MYSLFVYYTVISLSSFDGKTYEYNVENIKQKEEKGSLFISYKYNIDDTIKFPLFTTQKVVQK